VVLISEDQPLTLPECTGAAITEGSIHPQFAELKTRVE